MTDLQQNLNEETTIFELVKKVHNWLKILYIRKNYILFSGLIGGILGFTYAFFQPTIYIAQTTFVVEESKGSGSLNSLASLAGQFGFDLGGNVGGGLIAGDNILIYLKSSSLIREVLTSKWDSVGEASIADKYLELQGLKKNLSNKNINFPINSGYTKYSRYQDSLLKDLSERIIKNELQVSKVDKKAGFIQLSISTKSEELSKKICEKLLSVSIEKYITLKTTRQKQTVIRLQERADSILLLLNNKTYTSAELQIDNVTMDLNPLYKTDNIIKTERTTRDKTMIATIYGEVIKNLELAKFTLNQDIPVYQVVDTPYYPLEKSKHSLLKLSIVAMLIFVLLSSLSILIIQEGKNILIDRKK